MWEAILGALLSGAKNKGDMGGIEGQVDSYGGAQQAAQMGQAEPAGTGPQIGDQAGLMGGDEGPQALARMLAQLYGQPEPGSEGR